MSAPALSPHIVFRRRSGWEAADMGLMLWRQNWLSAALFLGLPAALPMAVRLFLPESAEWLAFIFAAAAWWSKPLLDRLCLQIASIRFFEPRAPLRRLFRGLGGNLLRGLAGDLLWRRFSPCRSARMPLLVLEHLKGKKYHRRKQLLSRNGLEFGFPLTLICLGFLLALEGGELLFAYSLGAMIRGPVDLTGFLQEAGSRLSILFWINMVLVETMYVFMGFGVYINSRVETEGWDIELLFKQCVEKARRGGRSGTDIKNDT